MNVFGLEIGHVPISRPFALAVIMRPRLAGSLTRLLCLIGAAAWILPVHAQIRPTLPQVSERVEVARVVVDARVLSADGSPVLGLGPRDFRVFVDNRPVVLERAVWATGAIADRVPLSGTPANPEPHDTGVSMLPGRQIVILVQRDLEPTRLQGLIAMLRRVRSFIDGLGADDRVAVFSYQSHLDIWTDYTTDRTGLAALLERQLIMHTPPSSVTEAAGLSLARHFDRDAGRRSSNVEQALAVVARALDQLPGEKSVVFFGYGVGDWHGGAGGTHLTLDDAYGEARLLLTRARAAVYCLDVTDAAAHSLEAGLKQVAADTGGFYLRTNDWPGLAMNRLVSALTGRYELSFARPDLPSGEHSVRVALVGRSGTVLARPGYRD